MSKELRIIAGSEQPGGAVCIYPVVRELLKHSQVKVKVLAMNNSAKFFNDNQVACENLEENIIKANLDDYLERTFNLFCPDLVLTGLLGIIPDGLDYRLLKLAKQKKIVTYGLLDSWMQYSSRFDDPVEGKNYYLPDTVAVMDEITVKEMALEGIPSDHLFVSGHPFISIVKEKEEEKRSSKTIFRKKLGLDKDTPLFIFFSEAINFFYHNEANYPGYDEFISFDIIINALKKIPECKVLLIKEHPRHPSLDLSDYKDCGLSLIRVDEEDPNDLLYYCDNIIGMSSSLLIFAHLIGRKVFIVQPNLIHQHDNNMLTRRKLLPNLESEKDILNHYYNFSNTEPLKNIRNLLKFNDNPAKAVADSIIKLL